MRFLSLLFVLLAAPALAQPWDQITPLGKRPAEAVETERFFDLSATDAVSFWVRALSDGERERATLSWRWQVKSCTTPATPLDKKGADDRPLAVHVWFPETAGDKMSGGLFGAPTPGYALTYVIGGDHAAGTVLPNPYLHGGYLKVVMPLSAVTAAPHHSEVDARADFREIYGMSPPVPPSHLALSIDTDDTDSACAVRVWFPEFGE